MKQIVVTIYPEKNTTTVKGESSWINLAYILEALEVTVEACIKEGIPKETVYKAIKDYFMQIEQGGGYKNEN